MRQFFCEFSGKYGHIFDKKIEKKMKMLAKCWSFSERFKIGFESFKKGGYWVRAKQKKESMVESELKGESIWPRIPIANIY